MERSGRLFREWCVSQVGSGLKSRSCLTLERIGRSSSPDFFNLLSPLQTTPSEPSQLAAVGGRAGSIVIETAIGFLKDDGRPVSIRGTFHVFVESESADLSVLGRDVTNNFGIIYDYPNQAVALLALPHYYEIRKAS